MSQIVCTECSRPLPPDAPDLLCPYCLLAMDDEELTKDESRPRRGRFEPPDPEDLQRHFDPVQLQVLELIGSGGMGAVYHARQPRLMRDVALKVLPPELATSPGFDDRFAREARVLAKLDHTNVVDVHDYGKAGPYSYLMLEYVDGVNLRDLMIGGEMNPSDGFEIVPQICDALQYAHDQGIVHRDIKPENILIDSNGRVKITDFGLAKLARPNAEERNLTGSHQVMGTPNYMAPEQIEKPRQVDHRADIYALGVVFYELLTGELPLGRFDPPSRKGNGSRRLDKVVMKTLEKEPERRYDQASEVKSDVEKAVGPNAGQAIGADHAAEFVSGLRRSARSGHKWIAEIIPKHQLLAKLGFVLTLFATYLAFFFSITALGEAILLAPLLFASGCGLSLLVDYLHPRVAHPRPVALAARPPLWIARQIKKLPVLADGEWRPTRVLSRLDRASIIALMTLGCWLLSVFLVLMIVLDDDFFPGVIIFLIAGFALARYQLAQQSIDALAKWQRWCLYPPVVLLLAIFIGPLLFAPGVTTAALLVESSHDVDQFLEGRGGTPSSLQAISFGIAIVLMIQMAWFAALMLLARVFRRPVRLVMFPFLRDWDGGGTITGSLSCTIGAVVFGIVAWTIAAA